MKDASIAIIGAGLAGLAAARRLREAGLDPILFEAAGKSGGRLSSEEVAGVPVDAGAVYVTAREEPFKSFMQEAVFAGKATGWAPTGRESDEPWLIGLPSMDGLTDFAGKGLDIRTHTAVERIGRASEGYLLQSNAAPIGPFDAVIVALPASAAEPLLHAHGKPFDRLSEVVMRPAIAGLFVFDGAVPITADWTSRRGDLSAAIRNSSKAGRGDTESFVVHAAADFSDAHFGEREDELSERLLELLGAEADGPLPPLMARKIRRWRQALVAVPAGETCLVGAKGRLVACGDWCIAARSEAAFISGTAAAEAVIASLSD
ncbi:putative NAD/FAD-dependent oxidoreductase [Rhodopseudomonas julia]|uniref:NAD/FAD-dependent oxidoreductase n=1 Tax=Rhodopseudomonas julia TaxID=200617 RepID=A0ABU0C4Z5_9BRAD|nr:FAD-dependent oxidoreductase [Rhodopseudomonas julia]MDQ0325591.1 putative NAD/FAD-dependent oxidoreductase [Rhodopseudomonas julia]